MRIVELKPQNVKIIYKPAVEPLKVGEFISFAEGELTLIAQVYRILSSDAADDFNQADLNFVLTHKYGKVNLWQGELVSAEATVSKTPHKVINSYINTKENALNFRVGASAIFDGEADIMNLEKFSTPAFIGYEKNEENLELVKIFCNNFHLLGKKTVIIDFKGIIDMQETTKVVAGINAKLPLNKKMIEDLCPKMLEGVSLESRVIIEDILIELAQYAQESQLGFIPISNLINVIDNYYKQHRLTPLILLKNKLRHLEKMNLFANTISEAKAIYSALEENNTIIFDISNIQKSWQNEFLNNLIEMNEKYKKDFYLFVTIDNLNFDNNIMNYLLFKAVNIGIKPVISANYRHLSFDSIYDFCKNIFLFKTYNTLKKRQILSDIIQTLPNNCFIATGELTSDLILIETLKDNSVQTDKCCEEYKPQEQNILTQPQQEETAIEIENIENNLQDVNMDTMNEAFEPVQNNTLMTGNPADFINTPINSLGIQDAFETITENKQIVEEEPVESEEIIEQETIVPQYEEVQPVTENEFEEPDETINISESNESNEPAEEIIEEEVVEPAEEIIIDESSIEDIPMQDISLDEDEILDLVEDTDIEQNDDDLFEEVQSDDDIENMNPDDLDFLNENTPESIQETENDEDLLDLIGGENQNQQADDDFELEEITQENAQEQIEEPEHARQEQLPVYDANYAQSDKKSALNLKEGDLVKHSKFGVGTITKITTHGEKVLCFINFDNLGRKLLDPELSQLEKID